MRSVIFLVGAVVAMAAPMSLRAQTGVPVSAAPAHPLDALTPSEIERAVALLRAANHLADGDRIVSLSLAEPGKADVRAWSPGKPFGRQAHAVALSKGQLAEAQLDLSQGKVVSWTPIANRQASMTVEELLAAADIVKQDAGWREAVARRGITKLDAVACFPSASGQWWHHRCKDGA